VNFDFSDNLSGDDGLGEHIREVCRDSVRIDTLYISSSEFRKSAEWLNVAFITFDGDYIDSHTFTLGELRNSLVEFFAFSLFLFGFGFVVSSQADIS
jgi:hypothetical protein